MKKWIFFLLICISTVFPAAGTALSGKVSERLLLKGSRNHMRSFISSMNRSGFSYNPVYITDGAGGTEKSRSSETGFT